MKPRPGSESQQTFWVCRIWLVVFFLQGISAHPIPFRRYPIQEHRPAFLTPQQPNPYPHNISPLPHEPAPCDCTKPIQPLQKEKIPHPVFYPYTVPIPWPTPFNGTAFAPIPKATDPIIPTFPESPNEDTYPLYIPVPHFEYVPVYYDAPRTVKPLLPKKEAIPENPQPIPSELTPQEVQSAPPETLTIPINSEPSPSPPVSTSEDLTPSPINPTSTSEENITHPDSSLPRQPSTASKVGSLLPDPQPVEGYPIPGHPVKYPHPTLNPFAHPVRVWTHPHDSCLDDYHIPYPPTHHTTYPPIHHSPYPHIHHTPYPPIHHTPYPPNHLTRGFTIHHDQEHDLVTDPHRMNYPGIPRAHYSEHYHPHSYAHGPYHHTPYFLVPERVPEPFFGHTFNFSVPTGAPTATPNLVGAPKIKPDLASESTPLVDKPVTTSPAATASEEPSQQLPPSKQPSPPGQSSSPADKPATIGGRSKFGLPAKSPQDKKEEDEAYVLYDPEYVTIVEGNDGDEVIFAPEMVTIYDKNPFPDQDNPVARPGQEVTDITPQEA